MLEQHTRIGMCGTLSLMTAEALDIFNYEPAREHSSEKARRHYWAVAIGLQQMDGLEVSPYLRKVASEYVAGERNLAATGELVRAYHGVGSNVRSAMPGGEGFADARVFPDDSFLVSFYENVLGRAEHNLDRERLICTALFENPALIRNVDSAEALDKRNLT